MKKILCIAIFCLAFGVFTVGGGWGAEFHVTTAAGFQTALTGAQNNEEDDTIYLAEGVYASTTPFEYQAAIIEDYALTIQAESGLTRDQVVLDGEGSRRVLHLTASESTFTKCHFTVRGVTIRDGVVSFPEYGAGIKIFTYHAAITVEDCVLENNNAESRGGGVFAQTAGGDILLTENRFAGNSGEGGAAYIETPGTATVVDNEIIGNSSPPLHTGGGIYAQATHNIVERNLIVGNQSGSSNHGGGLRLLANIPDATVTLKNNIIANNTALRGGGAAIKSFAANLQIYIINNTISGNEALDEEAGQGGGGIYLQAATEVHVYNNIIRGNTAFSGGDIWLDNITPPSIANGYNNDYHDMYGTWTSEGGNIDADPLFRHASDPDPAYVDLHLRSTSPCIDVGENGATGIPTTDIDGDSRPIDGDCDGTDIVDMGADEVNVTCHCVSSFGELTTALGTAEANGTGDVIMVQQGLYTGNCTYSSGEGHSLTLLGGYSAGCTNRTIDPTTTILDADTANSVLGFYDSLGADFAVDGFTVRNGSVGTYGYYGGGIYVQSSSYTSDPSGTIFITNNIITGNSADGSGGGVYLYTESSSGTPGDVIVTNNVVFGNSASVYGGGVYAASYSPSGTAGTVTATNNTITGNNSVTSSGGALLEAGTSGSAGTINCYNNIIRGNTATIGWDMHISDTGTANGYNNDYDLDAGGMIGSWDNGVGTNIDVDPQFIDPDHGDYRLRSTSLCKDAGHDTPPALPLTDFEGDARWIDTHVDIGADEVSVLTTCVSDATELQSALTAAETSGKGDVIMVREGFYTRTENFTYSSSEGHSITLLGGYTSECASRAIDPISTVLEGYGAGRVLNLFHGSGDDIRVDGFTVQYGDVAGEAGGGVYAASTNSGADPAGDVTLANNIVTGNTADGYGGGVYANSYAGSGAAGDVTLANNIVTGNTAGSDGGGVYAISRSDSGNSGTITLTNNTITANDADYSGGGVYFRVSDSPGGIVYAYNNIVWGNTATMAGGDVYLSKGTGTATSRNNDYTSMAGDGWDVESDKLDADPLFVGGGVYRLLPSSPCVDTGTNAAPSLPLYDFEGEDRIIDGDRDDTDTVDIGADEYSGHLPPCDYDADGHTDVGVYRSSTGVWYLRRSTLGSQTASWGGDGSDVPVPEDFDGDGDTDITVYRSSNGWWYVKGVGNYLYGGPGYIPIPGDYNGDGTIDLGVYRSSTGWWYVKNVGNYLFGGLPSDIPVPGDYDGDGSIEVAVYRLSTGWWYVKGVGQFLYGGLPDDIPVPGDYNGDGVTDIALFRPSTGWWYIRGVGSYLHGTSGDIPVPGDYDRDGVTEIGVYRPSNGRWYIKDVATVPIWGLPTDTPLTRNIWIWKQTGLVP